MESSEPTTSAAEPVAVAACCSCAEPGATCCGYCQRPTCAGHALDTSALRRRGWKLLPAPATLCPDCHGEQRWGLIEARLLLVGGPLLLAVVVAVALLPLSHLLRYGVGAALGGAFAAAAVVAHLRRGRYLDRRARGAPPK